MKNLRIVLLACLLSCILAGCGQGTAVGERLLTSEFEVPGFSTDEGFYALSDEDNASMTAILQTAVVQKDIWNSEFQTEVSATCYRLEMYGTVDGTAQRVAEFLVADNGESLFYIQNENGQYKSYQVVSLEGADAILTLLEEITVSQAATDGFIYPTE